MGTETEPTAAKKPTFGCLKEEFKDFDFEVFEALDQEIGALFSDQIKDEHI